MIEDPLGLAGRVKEIEQSDVVSIPYKKTMTSKEKLALMNAIFKAAGMKKKRASWNYRD